MNESEKLLYSAGAQWRTVRQLVDLVPIDVETRRTIAEKAEDARNLLSRRRSICSLELDPQAEIVEGMVGTLDDLIATPRTKTNVIKMRQKICVEDSLG